MHGYSWKSNVGRKVWLLRRNSNKQRVSLFFFFIAFPSPFLCFVFTPCFWLAFRYKVLAFQSILVCQKTWNGYSDLVDIVYCFGSSSNQGHDPLSGGLLLTIKAFINGTIWADLPSKLLMDGRDWCVDGPRVKMQLGALSPYIWFAPLPTGQLVGIASFRWIKCLGWRATKTTQWQGLPSGQGSRFSVTMPRTDPWHQSTCTGGLHAEQPNGPSLGW